MTASVLFAQSQVAQYVGGSILPFEVAEYLIEKGHRCSLYANFVDNPLKTTAESKGITIIIDPNEVNVFEYDLVWIQNQTAPLFRYELTEASKPRTLFVFAHLSPHTFLEGPGIIHEPLLADITLANSEETADQLISLGVAAQDIVLYPNPAPEAFWANRRASPAKNLKSVSLISNHMPEELLDSVLLIERMGIKVHLFGRDHQVRRINNRVIESTNVVISIGKSVHYAIARGIPAYVYDRFGGPGYLSAENFLAAARTNFSGRCSRRKLSPQEIADEIICGFEDASAFVLNVGSNIVDGYRMEPYIDSFLARVPTACDNKTRAERLRLHEGMLKRERLMALALRENYAGHMRANATTRRLRQHIKNLKGELVSSQAVSGQGREA